MQPARAAAQGFSHSGILARPALCCRDVPLPAEEKKGLCSLQRHSSASLSAEEQGHLILGCAPVPGGFYLQGSLLMLKWQQELPK